VKTYRRHNYELFRTADALVRARVHTAPLGQQTDLLSRLLSTPDPETGRFLDHQTVRDQILMHLSNGFNGPSITGAWLAYILATRPDVQEQLLAEIDGITGGDPDYDLRYDDLAALTYTTKVIKETLRIYPPLPVTIRRSLKDGTLGRYRIRKGDIILVGALAAQRDPRYWGPDPDRFDPEQFAPEKVAGRPRHAMIPFSIGKRQCMAQEVTFMMLRVVLFEIAKRYRLRLAPGATVTKNTVVSTKPAAVPVILLPRERDGQPKAPAAVRERPAAAAPAGAPSGAPSGAPDWGQPMEIPQTSAYRHLVIAYGSNFGANKELAERFAERSDFYGYTSDVITLNELASAPLRTQPWLLVVMTSTYTSNPPSNAAAFKSWLERTGPGHPAWRNCRYLVWGLGNSQWNAFLAFPRYVQRRLSELGATPLAEFAYADVGSPRWERVHANWNSSVWPALLELSGARPTRAAAARDAAGKAAAGALTGTDSNAAMERSLTSPGSRRPETGTQPRVLLAPAILTNAVGMDTVEARAVACRELQAAGSPRRTRHIAVSLPPGVTYQVGDHLGVCPKNGEEQVERLARHLGAAPDGLFRAPDAGLPLGAAGHQARRRPPGGGGAVQRHPLEQPGLHLPGGDRAVHRGRGAGSRARRGVARAARPPLPRPGPDPGAGRPRLAAARRRRVRLRLRLAADARGGPRRLRRRDRRTRPAATRARRGLPARTGNDHPLSPRPLGLTHGSQHGRTCSRPDRRGNDHVRLCRQRPRTAAFQRDRARARLPRRRPDLSVHLGHEHAYRPVTVAGHKNWPGKLGSNAVCWARRPRGAATGGQPATLGPARGRSANGEDKGASPAGGARCANWQNSSTSGSRSWMAAGARCSSPRTSPPPTTGCRGTTRTPPATRT
jgi:hypothetical protein